MIALKPEVRHEARLAAALLGIVGSLLSVSVAVAGEESSNTMQVAAAPTAPVRMQIAGHAYMVPAAFFRLGEPYGDRRDVMLLEVLAPSLEPVPEPLKRFPARQRISADIMHVSVGRRGPGLDSLNQIPPSPLFTSAPFEHGLTKYTPTNRDERGRPRTDFILVGDIGGDPIVIRCVADFSCRTDFGHGDLGLRLDFRPKHLGSWHYFYEELTRKLESWTER